MRQWYVIAFKFKMPQSLWSLTKLYYLRLFQILCAKIVQAILTTYTVNSESPYTFLSDCSHDHTMPGLCRGHICKESGEEPEECRNVGVALPLLKQKVLSLSLSSLSLSLYICIYMNKYIYINICIYRYTNIHIHIHIYISTALTFACLGTLKPCDFLLGLILGTHTSCRFERQESQDAP